MILSEFVEVRVNSNNVKYYESLGYEIPTKKAAKSTCQHTGKDWAYDFSKMIIVKVKDLPKGSPAKVNVLCDMCKKNKMFVAYETYNRVVKKTGNYVCQECSQEKMENTMKKRYGVKRALQSEVFLNAFKNTCIDKYGEDYGRQFTNKAFETFRDRTGYDYPSQSPDVRELITQSYIDHYGVNNPNNSPEIRERITRTLYANSSQKASKQQRYINNLYQGILNFPIAQYNVDIYLLNDNLIIEYDGGFHMGNVITGRETQEEFNQKEIIRNNVIKREGYKQMKIASLKDKLPSDQILFQMLQEARQYFSDYPEHSWIEYNISTSTLRNAENPNGIPFDFGELRTIKDSDIRNEQSVS